MKKNVELGFDAPELSQKYAWDSRLQQVKIVEGSSPLGNLPKEYIIIKVPPQPIDEFNNRSRLREVAFLEDYRDCTPEEFFQYKVLTRENFDYILQKKNQMIPRVSLTMPLYPSSFDHIDEHSIDRVVEAFSHGDEHTIYFHGSKLFFYVPASFHHAGKSEMLKMVEIVSLAHHLPIFPIVSFQNFSKFEYDPNDEQYYETSLATADKNRVYPVRKHHSLFKSNDNHYSQRLGRLTSNN